MRPGGKSGCVCLVVLRGCVGMSVVMGGNGKRVESGRPGVACNELPTESTYQQLTTSCKWPVMMINRLPASLGGLFGTCRGRKQDTLY